MAFGDRALWDAAGSGEPSGIWKCDVPLGKAGGKRIGQFVKINRDPPPHSWAAITRPVLLQTATVFYGGFTPLQIRNIWGVYNFLPVILSASFLLG